MAPIDDETLDRLLTRHLSARLDGQLGRAEAGFRERLNESGWGELTLNDSVPLRLPDDSQTLQPIRRPPSFWTRPYGWMISVVGSAVAASLATLLLLPAVHPTPGSGPDIQVAQTQSSTNPAPSPSMLVGSERQPMRYHRDQAWDEGIVMPEGQDQPMRKVRRYHMEHRRYFDKKRGLWVEQMIPRETIELYPMDTY